VNVSDVSRVHCDDARCEDRPNTGSTVRYSRHGERNGNTNLYFSNDHIGSVREVSDDTSVLAARFSYSPWGERALVSGSLAVSAGFTGHEWNETASLWLAKYREYDPTLARWGNEDPAGYPDGPNLFSYVRNKPTVLLDPLGLCGCNADCPSGEWRLDSGSFSIGAPGLSFSAGIGRLRCAGKPSMGKWVKVYCSPMGAHWAIGPSLSWQFRGTATKACNRSELREFETKAVIAEGPWLGTDGDSYWSGKGFALGVAWAPCRVVPF
jgi:RHS repeat-associated protein